MKHHPILFCERCSAAVKYQIPLNDNRQRAVCQSCGMIHYQNPKIVVGTLPVWNDKILLCKRAIQPRYGFWTLPAGFMEVGETCEQGAIRETLEESGAEVNLIDFFTILNVLRVAQVHIFFRAQILSDHLNPGYETLEAQLFEINNIPWDALAFPTVESTLRHYIHDFAAKKFTLHTGECE